MLRFAVVGNPVAHSKSPQIHSMFAKQADIELEYSRAEVGPGEFAGFVKKFFAEGGNGLNVTVPYKEAAFHLADSGTKRAELARAVNTLYLSDENVLSGDNTDGQGLVTDISSNLGISLEGKNILMLGAGGAVRGALSGLMDQHPGHITLLNRTLARAQQVRDEFASHLPLTIGSFDDPLEEPFDLIINGTSMGLDNEAPPISAKFLGEDCCCYDMMYGEKDTAFVTWAKVNGAHPGS